MTSIPRGENLHVKQYAPRFRKAGSFGLRRFIGNAEF
jgi:hypothetical protein